MRKEGKKVITFSPMLLETVTVKFSPTHWGKSFLQSAETLPYKSLVISSPLQGKNYEPHFGRIVQVRKNSGAYGSDTILLREADGKLQSYHNCSMFLVRDEFLPLYEEAMKWCDIQDIDKEGDIYNILGQNSATGYVVHGLDDTDGKLYSFALTIKMESNEKKHQCELMR